MRLRIKTQEYDANRFRAKQKSLFVIASTTEQQKANSSPENMEEMSFHTITWNSASLCCGKSSIGQVMFDNLP